jgi:hypothetical protein
MHATSHLEPRLGDEELRRNEKEIPVIMYKEHTCQHLHALAVGVGGVLPDGFDA